MTLSADPVEHHVTKVEATMADGRDLFYFDERPHPDRVLQDSRDLPVVVPGSAVRFDAVTGEWVGIAGHRQTRTYHPPVNACPLCPSTPENLSEIPSPDYDVVVFENRFPSFAGTGDVALSGELFDARPGVGRCEVVCFTADHTSSLTQLPVARMRTVISAWTDRTADLMSRPGVEQVFCFENRGVEIGVTLAHPHGQIYGYPFITPKTAAAIRNAQAYRDRTGGELLADIVDGELTGPRVVAQNTTWVAFVPFAARWPFEVHLYPRAQRSTLTDLDAAEQADLAELYLQVMRRMEGVFDEPLPAITAVHQAPRHADPDDFRLHLETFSIRRAPGRIKYLAGSESAMGAFVNDISPETAADLLRAVELQAAR